MKQGEFEGRALELLNATLQMLKQADDSPYVKDVMTATVYYDGVECDGYCLKGDIESLLSQVGLIVEDD